MRSEEIPLRVDRRRKNQNGSQGSKSPVGSPSGSPSHHAPHSNHIHRLASTISNKSVKAMDVCVFMKDGSAHEIFLENALTTTAGTLFSLMTDCLSLPQEASGIFSLWLTSPLLQLQLKSHHVPFRLCRQWPDLLDKYTCHSEELKASDEPVISFQRNAFYPKQSEKKITNEKLISRLFEEAKSNILESMYPCEVEDYEYLAGILAFLEFGRFDSQSHQLGFFTDNNLMKLLPASMLKGASRWSKTKGRAGPMMTVEASILRHWGHISDEVETKQECYRLFLEFCWKLPFYGCVFFRGQIERTGTVKVRETTDRKVYVGINRDGVYVIDEVKQELLLGLTFDELSWEFTEPVKIEDGLLPCLWLEFDSHERGRWCSKVLQVFSKQAVMMNALIEACVEELNKRDLENSMRRTNNTIMGGLLRAAVGVAAPVFGSLPSREPKTGLCTKMDRLCLATFSDKGELLSKKPKVKRSFTFHGLFSK